MSEEVWKDVLNYEGLYKVSNLGRVKSLDRLCILSDGRRRVNKGKVLKVRYDIGGYEKVTLYKNKIGKILSVHYIVISTFNGDRPDGLVINHIDENRTNNQLDNLEYITQKENINHGTGNIKRKYSQPNSIRVSATNSICKLEFDSLSECSRALGLTVAHISNCIKGKRKTHGGYNFEKI